MLPASAPVRHDPVLAADQLAQRLEGGWFERHGDSEEWYDLHSLPLPEFVAGLRVCDRETPGHPRSLVDLGCGIGSKLALAYFAGWEVTGVEHHADYAAAARRLVPEAEIVVADVADVRDLDRFDVVYSYRLAIADDRQHDLDRLIVSRMRRGALYFSAGSDPREGVEEVDAHAGVWRVT